MILSNRTKGLQDILRKCVYCNLISLDFHCVEEHAGTTLFLFMPSNWQCPFCHLVSLVLLSFSAQPRVGPSLDGFSEARDLDRWPPAPSHPRRCTGADGEDFSRRPVATRRWKKRCVSCAIMSIFVSNQQAQRAFDEIACSFIKPSSIVRLHLRVRVRAWVCVKPLESQGVNPLICLLMSRGLSEPA